MNDDTLLVFNLLYVSIEIHGDLYELKRVLISIGNVKHSHNLNKKIHTDILTSIFITIQDIYLNYLILNMYQRHYIIVTIKFCFTPLDICNV